MNKALIILTIIFIGIFTLIFINNNRNKSNPDTNEKSENTIDPNGTISRNSEVDDDVIQKSNENDSKRMSNDNEINSNTVYTGTVISGNKTPYIEFNEADYNNAIDNDKIILLNFYANWCPTCRAEETNLIDGFNSIGDSNLVAFRVNYKDTETDDLEKELADKHNVSYQHTKVLIIDGKEVYNKNEQWQSDDVNEFINGL